MATVTPDVQQIIVLTEMNLGPDVAAAVKFCLLVGVSYAKVWGLPDSSFRPTLDRWIEPDQMAYLLEK